MDDFNHLLACENCRGVKNVGNFLRLIMFWLKVTWLQRESKDVVHNKVCCH